MDEPVIKGWETYPTSRQDPSLPQDPGYLHTRLSADSNRLFDLATLDVRLQKIDIYGNTNSTWHIDNASKTTALFQVCRVRSAPEPRKFEIERAEHLGTETEHSPLPVSFVRKFTNMLITF